MADAGSPRTGLGDQPTVTSAPARTAVPAGRLQWAAPPESRAVYSIQHPAVWDELKRTGRYELGDGTLFDAPQFGDAYAWMRDQMRERLRVGMASCWPVWGWTRITRAVLAAACRRSAGQVLLRLQVPTSHLLESDFDAWHAALNADPLNPPEVSLGTPAWDRWEAQASALRSADNREGIQATWTRMFAVDAWGGGRLRQAAMPGLDVRWVRSAVHLDGGSAS